MALINNAIFFAAFFVVCVFATPCNKKGSLSNSESSEEVTDPSVVNGNETEIVSLMKQNPQQKSSNGKSIGNGKTPKTNPASQRTMEKKVQNKQNVNQSLNGTNNKGAKNNNNLRGNKIKQKDGGIATKRP